jgi:hypothetical protein
MADSEEMAMVSATKQVERDRSQQAEKMEEETVREVEEETVREVEEETVREVEMLCRKAADVWSSLDAPVGGCFSSFLGARAGRAGSAMMRKA